MARKVPNVIRQITDECQDVFTKPTRAQAVTLLSGAIITLARRIVSNVLGVLGPLAPGHWAHYHRIFSMRRWLIWMRQALCLGGGCT